MGRFNHEAVAVDPQSGIVYETEDRGDGLSIATYPTRRVTCRWWSPAGAGRDRRTQPRHAQLEETLASLRTAHGRALDRYGKRALAQG